MKQLSRYLLQHKNVIFKLDTFYHTQKGGTRYKTETQTLKIALKSLLILQYEVNKLINMTLGERERDIIRLYYGLDKECLYWEDIGKRYKLIALSLNFYFRKCTFKVKFKSLCYKFIINSPDYQKLNFILNN